MKDENKERNRQESEDFKAYRIAWKAGAIANRNLMEPEFQGRKRQKAETRDPKG